jgi:hypothetical protein
MAGSEETEGGEGSGMCAVWKMLNTAYRLAARKEAVQRMMRKRLL